MHQRTAAAAAMPSRKQEAAMPSRKQEGGMSALENKNRKLSTKFDVGWNVCSRRLTRSSVILIMTLNSVVKKAVVCRRKMSARHEFVLFCSKTQTSGKIDVGRIFAGLPLKRYLHPFAELLRIVYTHFPHSTQHNSIFQLRKNAFKVSHFVFFAFHVGQITAYKNEAKRKKDWKIELKKANMLFRGTDFVHFFPT